tara:strand:- start:29 stop:1393 length:1365 start_codon:yes stop_codon:yes gene_type:complete
MATNNLLTEAIADAKAIRETAIANAKLALEEAFTPHLKSMLAAKLDEMDKKDEKEVKEEEEKVEEMDAVSWNDKNNPSRSDSVTLKDPKKVGQSTPNYSINEDEEIDEEIDLDELLAELDDSDKVDENKRTDAEQEGYKDGFEDAKDDIEAELKKMKVSEEKEDDKKMDEAKKAEDKDDVKEAKDEDDKKMDEAKKAEDKEDVKEDARTDAEEEGYLDGMKDEKEDMEDDMDDEEIDLEDMSEDDLKGFIEDVIKDMVADGEIEPGDEFVEDEVEVEDVEDIEVEDDVDVDVEIDEAKKEELDERSRVKGEKGPGNEDGDKDDTKIEKETEKMRFKEELEDAIAQVNELKAELNEVNLLNAKLLYTNKIFKAKNLTESKKVKVLKAFDKAKDVRQAKTIFETLSEGLLDKSPINESIKKGAASKASGLEPKAAKQPIIESNDVYNRMRKLAGLL